MKAQLLPKQKKRSQEKMGTEA